MKSYETVATILIGKIKEVVPELESHNIQLTDSLRVMGINSIDRVDILVETMEEFNISLPLTLFSNSRNIGELAQIIYRAGKQ